VPKARAVAFANAVNVRSGDVPGMVTSVRGFETGVGPPPFGSCTTNVHASDRVVAVESPRFLRSGGQRRVGGLVIVGRPPIVGLHSVVYVMREPGLASRDVVAARRDGAPECVERLSAREAAGRLIDREPYKRDIAVSSLPFPLAGVVGYALRVDGTLAARPFHQKKRPAFYEDTFGFAAGPAEIVLHTAGAPRPVPSAEEQRLLSLLHERAKAHALS
jgi:hypothetical protein